MHAKLVGMMKYCTHDRDLHVHVDGCYVPYRYIYVGDAMFLVEQISTIDSGIQPCSQSDKCASFFFHTLILLQVK